MVSFLFFATADRSSFFELLLQNMNVERINLWEESRLCPGMLANHHHEPPAGDLDAGTGAGWWHRILGGIYVILVLQALLKREKANQTISCFINTMLKNNVLITCFLKMFNNIFNNMFFLNFFYFLSFGSYTHSKLPKFIKQG